MNISLLALFIYLESHGLIVKRTAIAQIKAPGEEGERGKEGGEKGRAAACFRPSSPFLFPFTPPPIMVLYEMT